MDHGFHRAGHRTVWFCEADAGRRRVLARHWGQSVPIYPDLTTLDPAELAPVDVLSGGTPCPAWSNAGRRAGFNDPRARLYWDFIRIRNAIRPEWTVWENVPGVFSTHGGRDFALVLEALVGAGVAVPHGGWERAGVAAGPMGTAAWRVIDAQYFGVPQRRRRVFVVADLGGVRAEQVLFERPSSNGHPAPSGEAGADAARSFGASVAGTLGAHHSGGADPTDLERGGGHLRQIVGCLDGAGGGASMTTTLEPDTLLSQPHSPQEAIPAQAPQGDAARMTTTSQSREREREVGRTLTARGGRLDGDTDTFVLSRDADASGQRGQRRQPDAGSKGPDRGDDR